jgi:hypothetical protein
MFIKQRDLIDFGTSDKEDNQLENITHRKDRSMYRSNYPYDTRQMNTDEDFIKSLEGLLFHLKKKSYLKQNFHFLFLEKARSSQKTTIGRPQSVFTDSSFSLPTAYYEQTTPYGEYNRKNKNEDYNFDDDSFNAFDDDDDKMDNIIEAFNPNVKVNNRIYSLKNHT